MTAASLLVLVRDSADLKRACADLSEFLAFRRRLQAAAQETLLGLWVDRRWVARMPDELHWHEPDGTSGSARIRESAGVDGIWMLCWLDVPDGVRAPSRRAVLTSLMAAFPADADRPPDFVPVFSVDAPAAEVQAELWRLADVHADLVPAPILQDPGSGRLATPSWHQWPGRDRTPPLCRDTLDRQH